MQKHTKQTGSAHLIVIITLVIAVIGLLGYVFWMNFASSPSAQEDTNQSQASSSADLTEKATISRHGVTLSMMYPAGWVREDPADNGNEIAEASTLTSPDGDVVLSYGVRALGPVGGTCGESNLLYKNVEKINGSGNLSYKEYIVEQEAGVIGYGLGLADQSRTEYLESVDVSSYYCDSLVFNLTGVKTSLTDLGETDVAYYVVGELTTLQEESGAVRADVTFDDAKKALESEVARQAKAIIASAVITIE